jgi:hypothetical protein
MGLAGRLRVLSIALLLAALAATWAGPGVVSAAKKAKCPVTKAAKRAARPHKKAKHHKKANSRKKKRCKRAVAGTRPHAPPLPLPLPPAVPPAGSVPTATRGIPPERFFAADSVWNAPLSPGAPLDPTSETRTAAFRADIARQMTERIGPWIEERSNSTPIYVVGPDQPRSPVRIDRGGARLAPALAAVPIPPGARPAAGVDAHMTIYQPASDTMWEFWHADRDALGWHAGWAGGMRHVSSNPGYYTNTAWEGLAPDVGWDWGSTASSLPMLGGVATIAELRRGRIDHALAINIPAPCAGVFAWPAQRTDGTSTATDCLPEGARLRLDPALDLSRLRLPRVTRILAEAAQRYGMIVRDKTGHATTFFAEDATPTGSDPYFGAGGLYGGLRPREIATPFPWDSVQLLDMSLCTSAPCLR